MRVVIAPDSFKGSIGAADAAQAMADGWLAVRAGDEVTCLPLADGGEGTLDVIAAAVSGARWQQVTVTGPGGQPADCPWLTLPGGTAVIELARASGLPLLARPDPLGAHTTGLGQVTAAALADGAREIVITLGGSASTDGGTGALAALGARFLDAAGRPLRPGGGALPGLAAVDVSGLRPAPPGGARLLADVEAPLLGPAGAAAVFGPQKGASPQQIRLLEQGLARLAALLGGDPDAPGAGAAGGTGYGFAAAWGAVFRPGAAELCRIAGLDRALAGAGLVITGEGRWDDTSVAGKVTGKVLGMARWAGVPAALVAGQIATPAPAGAIALADLAGGAEAALADPGRWLRQAGQQLAASVREQAPRH
ncbi:MAG TPA: glycerate kinase [Streptosporangiaceae bacterium]|nr:glycerate kinase [Streptosporangiaceae bacterium]